MAIQEVYQEFLEGMGHQVILASNGEEALEQYQQAHNQIDLVILDMIMPIKNGRETLKAMRAINPDIKAVMSSGYMAGDSPADLLSEGAKSVIKKPFVLNDLTDCIEKVFKDEED